MMTLLADFTTGLPARPFAGSVASAAQFGNAAAVPGIRETKLSSAKGIAKYERLRIVFLPGPPISYLPKSVFDFSVSGI